MGLSRAEDAIIRPDCSLQFLFKRSCDGFLLAILKLARKIARLHLTKSKPDVLMRKQHMCQCRRNGKFLYYLVESGPFFVFLLLFFFFNVTVLDPGFPQGKHSSYGIISFEGICLTSISNGYKEHLTHHILATMPGVTVP